MPHIPFLESRLLADAGFRHAFFTRAGGVSTGDFATLNLAYNVGDDPACVDENLRRAAEALGVASEDIRTLSQVHGSDVVEVRKHEAANAPARAEGDALIARGGALACGVRTADCVPLLIGDTRRGTAAAVHAGWRGIVRGVVASALAAFERLGSARSDLVCAIGPHISLEAFEIGTEIAAELERASTAHDALRTWPDGKPHASLRAIVTAQLRAGGFAASQIDHVDGCTFGDASRFFSYRRDGARSGRMLSAIVAGV